MIQIISLTQVILAICKALTWILGACAMLNVMIGFELLLNFANPHLSERAKANSQKALMIIALVGLYSMTLQFFLQSYVNWNTLVQTGYLGLVICSAFGLGLIILCVSLHRITVKILRTQQKLSMR